MLKLKSEYFAKSTVFLFAYIASFAGFLSLQKASAPPSFWMPSGVALAIILLEGPEYWPVLFIGGIGSIWFLNVSLYVGIMMGSVVAASALISHRMLRSKYIFDVKMSRLRDVISFISSAVIFSSIIAATIGTTTFYYAGIIKSEQFYSTLIQWFSAQAIGIQIVSPFLLSFFKFEWRKHFAEIEKSQIVEGLLLFGGLTLTLFLLFSSATENSETVVPTLPYIVFPFIIWGALRFGVMGSTTMNLLIGAFAVWGTLRGLGPFSKGPLTNNIYIAQGFGFIVSATGLIIASTTAERRKALSDRAEALSERQKIQVYTDAMRESEAFLNSVIDNLPNIVFVKDAKDLRFVRLNNALEDLIGYSRDELLGKNDYDFFPTEQADHFTANDRAVLNLGMLVDVPEEVVTTRYRGERLLHTRKIPIFDQKTGEPMFLLGIAEDITESKKAEQYRSKLQTEAKAAEMASKTKSLFLANMSHEIRTPLGAILGFTALLKDPNLSQSERESYFEVINRNGRALSQLIDDILDLSKVEAGRLVVENIETNLAELIADVGSIMELRAQQKGLGLAIVTSPHLPRFINTDPNRLRQILVNIIGNAIKFTEFGEVTVRVTAEQGPTCAKKIIFSVHDTGPGIAPEQAHLLFSWFTQADASTTRKYGGTGLGLALSRRLANSLGGDVYLKSSNEDGSCFVVTISTDLEKGLPKNTQTSNLPNHLRPASNNGEQLKGVRVLLVDDAPDNRALVEKLLEKKGIDVTTAQNGREGINYALNSKFDVILMDVQMPVLGGIEATEELRRRGVKTPIIALTAHAMMEEKERTRKAGCNAHLTKPINISELFSTISKFSSDYEDLELH